MEYVWKELLFAYSENTFMGKQKYPLKFSLVSIVYNAVILTLFTQSFISKFTFITMNEEVPQRKIRRHNNYSTTTIKILRQTTNKWRKKYKEYETTANIKQQYSPKQFCPIEMML